MKKQTILTLILSALLLFFFTALGNAEGNAEKFCPGRSDANQKINLEQVSLTGKLILKSNEWPQLASGGKVYTLRYPQRLDINLDVKDGEEITVKGYICPRADQSKSDAQQYLRVTQATIKGKEYVLPFGGRNGCKGKGQMGRGSNSCNQSKSCW